MEKDPNSGILNFDAPLLLSTRHLSVPDFSALAVASSISKGKLRMMLLYLPEITSEHYLTNVS